MIRRPRLRRVAVVLAGIAFSVMVVLFVAKQARERAVAGLEQLGGRVISRGEPAGAFRQWLQRWGWRIPRDRDALVNLAWTEFGDEDVFLLRKLRSVERLNLAGTRVSNGSMPELARLSGLRALDLSETSVTGEGLAALQSLSDLQYLYLRGCAVSDEHLPLLNPLTELREVHLQGTEVTAEAAEDFVRRWRGPGAVRVFVED